MSTDTGAEPGPNQGMATVIIGEHVAPGCEERHRAWQTRVNEAASGFTGFLAAEVRSPTEDDGDWTVLYRFDSVPHLQSWLNSSARQELLNEGAELHDRPATQQVIVGGGQPEELVTVVVTHRVPDGRVDEFLGWQARMTEAERAFVGFKGAELFRPVPGVQDEWTAVYRFDEGQHLQAWLDSPERRALLEDSPEFGDFQLKAIHSSFGNWFELSDREGRRAGPTDFTTSIAVYVGLYPTVMLLTLGLSKLFPGLAMWQSLLIGNLVSSFVMTYLTMPWYVNRLLRPWLTAEDPPAATTAKWLAVSAGTVLAWALVFWLVTARVWTLP